MVHTEPALFGDLLRRHRREAELTQEELAERASLSARVVSDLERDDNRIPQIHTVRQLADALHLSRDDRDAFTRAARRKSSLRIVANGPGQEELTEDRTNEMEHEVVPHIVPIGSYLGAQSAGPMVGRERELHLVLAVVDAVPRENGQLVLLSGEAGIGKTRLAQTAAQEAESRGFLVATGRCYEPEQTVPFYPFLEALATAYQAASPAVRKTIPDRWSYLTRLLPDQDISTPHPSSDAPDDQQRLFRAIAGFLRAITEERPVALILDDLHWADDASLKLLLHLARCAAASPMLLLGTHRDAEVHQHPLEQSLLGLDREGLVQRVQLRRLDEGETFEFMAARLDEPDNSPELARLVHRRTEGNPFFIIQVIQSLIEHGHVHHSEDGWTAHAIEQILVPESVRAVIGQRLSRLTTEAQAVLEEASVLGQVFIFDDLERMTGRAEDDLERGLEEARKVGLVRYEGKNRYAYDHALTQQTLYEALAPRRKRKLHGAAGQALETLPEQKRADRAGELVWHFLQSDNAGRALPYAMLAGDRAETVFAHAEAEGHYRTALELAVELDDAHAEARALEQLGRVLKSNGRLDQALAVSERAAQLYEGQGNLEATGRVVAHIGQLHGERGTFAEGERRIRAMLAEFVADEPSPALAALYAALERLSYCGGRYRDSLAAAERAAELARTLMDDRLLAYVERNRAWTLLTMGDVVEARRLLQAACVITDRFGDPYTLTSALQSEALFAWATGSPQDSLALCQRGLEVAERLDDAALIGGMCQVLGAVHFDSGEWGLAENDVRRALALLDPMRSVAWGAWALGILAELLVLQGRWDEARECLEECRVFLEEGHDMPVEPAPRAALALFDLLHARPQSAIDRFVGAAGQSLLAEATVCTTLPYLAWAQLELGELDQAEATILAGIDRGVRQGCIRSQADALCVYGMILNRQERWKTAAETLELAVITARRLPYPFGEARALYEWGRVNGKQPEAARRRLTEALAIFQKLGAAPFVALTLEALCKRADVPPSGAAH